VPVSSTVPALVVRLADVSVLPVQGGIIEIPDRNERFQVIDVREGEIGTARLILGRVEVVSP